MKELKPYPPKIFLRFFQWYCKPNLRDHIEGDLIEVYWKRVKTNGKRTADIRFLIDVLLLLRPGIIRPIKGYQNLNTYSMYKSYLRIGWRNMWKNTAHTSINIIGLAAGMSVALLIGLWVWDELTFDSYFENRNQLAQVMVNQSNEGMVYTGTTVQMPLGEALRMGYSGDFKAISLASYNLGCILSNGETRVRGKAMWVQSDFPQMFTLKILSGNLNSLKDPSSVLISSSLAKSLYGNDDPINKMLRIDTGLDMVVGGVYADLPANTTFHETQVFLPWENKNNWLKGQTDWTNHNGQLFVQLHDNTDINIVSEKVKAVPTSHITKWKEEALLHPFTKVHLYDKFENGKATGGRIEYVWLFGIIGAFVLLLACINLMNLSTARSEKRAKEVGVRKAIGSDRGQLVGQFLFEALLVTSVALVLSLVIVQVTLPMFNVLAEKTITIPWDQPAFWAIVIGFTLLTGLASGSYPAFYLSSFRAIKVLKGSIRVGRLAVLPRKVLVVVQFTVSITLVIATIVVFRQIEHAKNRRPGFAREGLITIGIDTQELRKNIDVVKNELLQKGLAENVALSSQSPAHFGNNNGINWRGKDPNFVIFFRNVGVNADFGKTVGWTIKQGRDFSTSPADSSAMIINENAAKVMAFENPIGEVAEFHGKKYTIIGVTQDMITQSPYEPTQPSFFTTDDWTGLIVLRLNSTTPVHDAIAGIEQVFKKYNPQSPFEFNFVDEAYARKYSAEERIGKLAALFAMLAVMISCLGLFGIASFVAEQRTKEIGIRKVVGASVFSLWKMLLQDFILLIGISCIIAVPLSYYFMNGWLQNYPYHTNISWWVLAGTCVGSIVVTLLTVSYQAISAALMNPVRSLRSE